MWKRAQEQALQLHSAYGREPLPLRWCTAPFDSNCRASQWPDFCSSPGTLGDNKYPKRKSSDLHLSRCLNGRFYFLCPMPQSWTKARTTQRRIHLLIFLQLSKTWIFNLRCPPWMPSQQMEINGWDWCVCLWNSLLLCSIIQFLQRTVVFLSDTFFRLIKLIFPERVNS